MVAFVSVCVTYPPKPRANTVTYVDTPMHIVFARSRWWEPHWWDLARVSTRDGSRFQACSFIAGVAMRRSCLSLPRHLVRFREPSRAVGFGTRSAREFLWTC